jgi:hypothetical protein
LVLLEIDVVPLNEAPRATSRALQGAAVARCVAMLRALKKLQITDEGALTVSKHEIRLVATNVDALDSIGAAL